MPGFASFQIGQKFTIYLYQLIDRKFTDARSLLSIGLLSPGSCVNVVSSLWPQVVPHLKALITNL